MLDLIMNKRPSLELEHNYLLCPRAKSSTMVEAGGSVCAFVWMFSSLQASTNTVQEWPSWRLLLVQLSTTGGGLQIGSRAPLIGWGNLGADCGKMETWRQNAADHPFLYDAGRSRAATMVQLCLMIVAQKWRIWSVFTSWTFSVLNSEISLYESLWISDSFCWVSFSGKMA
jgi:hypothetical protein